MGGAYIRGRALANGVPISRMICMKSNCSQIVMMKNGSMYS